MRFHWIVPGAINTIYYRDIIFGHKLKAVIWKGRRADYVTITKKEVADENKEIKKEELEDYMIAVRSTIVYTNDGSIPIYIN